MPHLIGQIQGGGIRGATAAFHIIGDVSGALGAIAPLTAAVPGLGEVTMGLQTISGLASSVLGLFGGGGIGGGGIPCVMICGTRASTR